MHSAPAADSRWLLRLCLARLGFSLINTVYAALIPLLQPAWGMSASQAGAVQSAWHGGYIVSLVAASFLAMAPLIILIRGSRSAAPPPEAAVAE